ncbi:unnamed protein product [Angiostrongylus costaricensis]|uniref:BPI2 domain-containing protein n=1 Tax=Angiostrongylus costaricensis TaxID=334426 RepID=A0A158PDD9_ANGCS|nr:unnamed protein product [Angiostrongylus costaricensis]
MLNYISAGLVEYEGPRISIPPSQQCFPEGCVQIHSLRMVNFRQPSKVSFDPYPPNQFIIRLMDFDLLSVIQVYHCQIDSGIVDAKVTNMGLITDLVNMRFRVSRGLMLVQLEKAICESIYRLTQAHFSSRLSRIPRQLLISELFKLFLSVSPASPKHSNRLFRSKRANDDYYDDVEGGRKTQAQTSSPAEADDPIERLRHIWIDLTMLDASATYNDFTVGLSGAVSNSRTNDVSPYRVPFPFRLPQSSQQRMIEVMISDYTINSMLYHAHRTNSLLFHVNSRTPGLGSLLKTTCSADEVCLSDHVEEIGETHPNKTMQLIIRTTSPPLVTLQNDVVKLTLDGRCLFLIEDTQRQIGVIPFSADVYAQLRTVGTLLRGKENCNLSLLLPLLLFLRLFSLASKSPKNGYLLGPAQPVRTAIHVQVSSINIYLYIDLSFAQHKRKWTNVLSY